MIRVIATVVLLAACASNSPSGEDGSSGETSTTTLEPWSSSSTTTTTTGTTTIGSSTTTSDDESSTGMVIDGYPCSVQVVTEGALYDPLIRGDDAGVFPPIVADALEDTCGCHTLTGGAQNVRFPELQAPGGTLFFEYTHVANGVGPTALGTMIEDEVRGFRMPPGSCPKPPEIAEVLIPWFDQGMPDGATFVP